MRKENYADMGVCIDILTKSFIDNKSVNYIIKNDNKRVERIRYLMEYSYRMCRLFGRTIVSNDKKTCALIIYPEKKKSNLQSVMLDIRLIFKSTGFGNISKAMKREAEIKSIQPKEPAIYLWFIGVEPSQQSKGFGNKMLNEIIDLAKSENRVIVLETSVSRNIPWYEKNGFKTYKILDFGYQLFCMKWEI